MKALQTILHVLIKNKAIILQLLPLPVTSLIFDHMFMMEYAMDYHTEKELAVFKALADNIGHFLIAVFTWGAVIEYHLNRLNILHMLLCGLMASLIDVDHFIAASSFKLKDAVHLPNRPFLHNSSLILLIVPFIIFPLYNRYNHRVLEWSQLSLVAFTALTTHHLRDGKRRGLWIWPFGSTPPLDFDYLYILLIALIIVVVRCYLYKYVLSHRNSLASTPSSSILSPAKERLFMA